MKSDNEDRSESPASIAQRWLRDPNVSVDWIDHQDGPWVLASAFSTSSLIEFYDMPDAIPARRDQVLYAIGVNLEMLLDPDDRIDETLESERELVLAFAKSHWAEMLRICDFDTYVLPYMQQHGL